jgi:hypothetical protein
MLHSPAETSVSPKWVSHVDAMVDSSLFKINVTVGFMAARSFKILMAVQKYVG